ncbi:Spc97 Spc98 and Tudor-knot and MRG domain contain ing protein [Trichuris trichiura]|uniref:Gamma-tubulin complex component n=1 Tax=Trichuris trichiura TaxID=36087 RepID=A0A077Z1N6_TRITR|nr:Spc97 Spc98 and Tudor-knot and MRG domain contain ing protein [Trichuris trichiura]
MEKPTVAETAVMYSVGEKVECEYRRQWYKATIIGQKKSRKNQLYRIHYVGWGTEWDESVPASRLRKVAATKKSVSDKAPAIEDPIARLKEKLKTCVAPPGSGIPKLNEPMNTGKKRRPRRPCNVQDEKTAKTTGKHCRKRNDSSVVHEKKGSSSTDDSIDKRLIPEGLIDVLRDDHHWVTKDLYIPNIPAFPSAAQILSKFCDRAISEDLEAAGKYRVFLRCMKSLFNKCLPLQLLYRFERFQLEEITRTMPQVAYCDIYGYAHLVRFCFSLRDILKSAKVTKSEMETILPLLLEFFAFLKRKKRLLRCSVACSQVEGKATIKDMLIKLAKEEVCSEAIFGSSFVVLSPNLLSRSYVDKTERMMENVRKGLSSFGREAMAKKLDEIWESLQQSASSNFTAEIVRFLLRLGKLEVMSTERPLMSLNCPLLPKEDSELSSIFDDSISVEPRYSSRSEGWRKMTYQSIVHDCILMLQGIKTCSMTVDTLNGLKFCSLIEMPSFVKAILRKLSWYAIKYMKLSSFCDEVHYATWHGAYTRSLDCAIRQELNSYLEILVKMESEWKEKSEYFNEESVLNEIGLLFEEVELMLWPMKDTLYALSSLVDLTNVDSGVLISQAYVMMHTRDPEMKKIAQYTLVAMCSMLKRLIVDWMFVGAFDSPSDDVLLVGKSIIYVRNICSHFEDIPAFEKQRHLLEEMSPTHMFQQPESNAFARCVKEACVRVSAVVLEIMSSTFDFGFFMNVVKKVILLGRGDFFTAFIISARTELEKPLPEASIIQLSSFVKVSLRECYEADIAARMNDWLIVELPDFQCSRKTYDGVIITYKVPKPIYTVLDPGAPLDYKRLFLFLWRLRHADYLMYQLVYKHSRIQLHLSTLPEILPLHRRLSLLYFSVTNFVKQLVYYAFIDVIERASIEFFGKFNSASDFDCVVSAHRSFLSWITDKLFLSREKLSLRVHLRTILDVVFELIDASNSFDDLLETELAQITADEIMEQLRLNAGLWSVNDEENLLATKRREQLIDTVRSNFAPQLRWIETEYYIAASNFLQVLLKESDSDLRYLSFSIDSSNWYCSKCPA